MHYALTFSQLVTPRCMRVNAHQPTTDVLLMQNNFISKDTNVIDIWKENMWKNVTFSPQKQSVPVLFLSPTLLGTSHYTSP